MKNINNEKRIQECLKEDSSAYIFSNKSGSVVYGREVDIMSCLAALVHSFKKNGIDEKIIRDAVDLGLQDIESIMDDVEKIIKNASVEELRGILIDLLGD